MLGNGGFFESLPVEAGISVFFAVWGLAVFHVPMHVCAYQPSTCIYQVLSMRTASSILCAHGY